MTGISISRACPPIAPTNDEAILPPDPSFEAECKAALLDVPEKFRWKFKGSIQTKRVEWGLIWRADFESPEHVGRIGFVNRVTCWQARVCLRSWYFDCVRSPS